MATNWSIYHQILINGQLKSLKLNRLFSKLWIYTGEGSAAETSLTNEILARNSKDVIFNDLL